MYRCCRSAFDNFSMRIDIWIDTFDATNVSSGIRCGAICLANLHKETKVVNVISSSRYNIQLHGCGTCTIEVILVKAFQFGAIVSLHPDVGAGVGLRCRIPCLLVLKVKFDRVQVLLGLHYWSLGGGWSRSWSWSWSRSWRVLGRRHRVFRRRRRVLNRSTCSGRSI